MEVVGENFPSFGQVADGGGWRETDEAQVYFLSFKCFEPYNESQKKTFISR